MAITVGAVFFVTVLIVLLYWYVRFRQSRKRLYELANKIPKIPKTLPLIGNIHQLLGDTKDLTKYLKWATDISLRNGGIAGVWSAAQFQVYITNPEDIEIVMNNCVEKNIYAPFKPWLGDGLVSAPAPIWKKHRQVLSPTFGQKILDNYIVVFNEKSEILVSKLKKEVGKQRFDVFKYNTTCTLDIVTETIMGGVLINAQDNPDHPFIKATEDELEIVIKRIFKFWLQPDFIFNLTSLAKREKQNVAVLKALSKEVIHKKKLALESKTTQNGYSYVNDNTTELKSKKRKTCLDLILELGRDEMNWTEQELGEEVDSFILAGNDTTAHTASIALVMLGARPKAQEKAVEELFNIFGDSQRQITKEDISKMTYLECVIKESLRLFPAAFVSYRLLDSDLQITNYVLPAKTLCYVNMYGVHRRRDIWGDDVDDFNPDRFLPENHNHRHRCSFAAFGSGPRNCIGKNYAFMMVKTVLATVLRNYVIAADENIDAIQLKSDFLLKPVNGYNISIYPRKL